MKSKPNDLKQTIPANNASLGRILKQSENVEDAVEQAAGELTAINAILKQENKVSVPAQTIRKTIEQNKYVEHKVAKAADDLNQVNTQLAEEMEGLASVASELADAKADLAEEVERRASVASELADAKADLAEEVERRASVASELADAKADLAEEVEGRAGVASELANAKADLAGVRDDLSKSQAKEGEARTMALLDPLTGIPNRTSYEQALDHGLVQARRHGWGLAVLFIDIDQFKSINDSYGHDMGDKVLLMMANRLQSSIRQEDTVSRWGGDEFVCLLLEVKQEAEVSRFAQKLVSRIAEDCEFNGTVLSVKVSLGIAIYPADGQTADSLFKNADAAMLKAKRTKKRVALFRESSPG